MWFTTQNQLCCANVRAISESSTWGQNIAIESKIQPHTKRRHTGSVVLMWSEKTTCYYIYDLGIDVCLQEIEDEAPTVFLHILHNVLPPCLRSAVSLTVLFLKLSRVELLRQIAVLVQHRTKHSKL